MVSDTHDSDATPDADISPDDFRIPTIDELDTMRVDHGLSMSELSRRAGMEADRFSYILNKDADTHTSTLRAFLEVLQTTPKMDEDDLSEKRGPKPERSSVDHSQPTVKDNDPTSPGSQPEPEHEPEQEPVKGDKSDSDDRPREELSLREQLERDDPEDWGLSPEGERP